MPEELLTEARDIELEAANKTIPRKSKKWLSEEALQIAKNEDK